MSPLVGILREQLDSKVGRYVPRTVAEHVVAAIVKSAASGDLDAARLIFELTYVSDYEPKGVMLPKATQPVVGLDDEPMDMNGGHPGDDPRNSPLQPGEIRACDFDVSNLASMHPGFDPK